MNQPLAMMNQSYGPWQQQNPSQILMNPSFNLNNQSMAVRNNWKGKNKFSDRRKSELKPQNRSKSRKKFCPKKKFRTRSAPYAPRNTTSFIIRAKKAGGIASLVSPCPVTPAVLPTPVLTPSTEDLGDMAKEKWGVDGYGTMKGLIRLRDEFQANDDEEGGGSSISDAEEHVEMERRLDHDLSRFEMIYPNNYNYVLENRLDDILQTAEEENSTLKEKLFLMGREMEDLKRRLLLLERRNQGGGGGGLEEDYDEVIDNQLSIINNQSEECYCGSGSSEK